MKVPLPKKLPTAILRPRVPSGAKRLRWLLSRFAVVLGLTLLVLVIPRPEGLSAEGHRSLALFVFTASILALEPLSLPIAALMVPLAAVALDVATAAQAFETFSRPVVFLILASLFLAETLRKHGLARRVALRTLAASGGAVPRLLLGIMGIAALFSMWVNNTATAAVLIPVALTISREVEDEEARRKLLVLLVLGIAYGASLGGMATVLGASANAVTAGVLSETMPFSFVDWMKYGVPAFVLVFPLTWWLLLRLIRVPMEQIDVEPVEVQLQKLGRLSRREWEILGALAVAIVLWIGGSFFEAALDLPRTLLSAAMVAVAVVGYLALRKIILWEDAREVSWGIFLIIGAGLSLGATLDRSGATDWLADLLVPLVSGLPFLVTLLVLVYLSALLTNVLNNTTIAAVFVPILVVIAADRPELSTLQLALPVALATTFGYSLPSASGRMSLIAASGIVDRGDMMRYGLLMTGISSALLGIFFWLLTLAGWI